MKLTKVLLSEFWKEEAIVFKSLRVLLYPTYKGKLHLFSLKAQRIKDDKTRKDFYRRTITSIQNKIERSEKHEYSIRTLLTTTFIIALACIIASLTSKTAAMVSYWITITTLLVFVVLFIKYMIISLGLTNKELRMFLDYVQKKLHGKSYNKRPIPVISDDVFAVFNGTKNELAAWFYLT